MNYLWHKTNTEALLRDNKVDEEPEILHYIIKLYKTSDGWCFTIDLVCRFPIDGFSDTK